MCLGMYFGCVVILHDKAVAYNFLFEHVLDLGWCEIIHYFVYLYVKLPHWIVELSGSNCNDYTCRVRAADQ